MVEKCKQRPQEREMQRGKRGKWCIISAAASSSAHGGDGNIVNRTRKGPASRKGAA